MSIRAFMWNCGYCEMEVGLADEALDREDSSARHDRDWAVKEKANALTRWNNDIEYAKSEFSGIVATVNDHQRRVAKELLIEQLGFKVIVPWHVNSNSGNEICMLYLQLPDREYEDDDYDDDGCW